VAELTPIPTAQRPADSSYQPISGYAVAAGVATTLFAIFLLANIISLISSGRSIIGYVMLLVPAVGIVLAIIGRSHIKRSEGTRTGLRVVNISWWVCVLGGAGFGAFLYANQVVMEKESAKEANAFFTKLNSGDLNDAFLSLLPPEEQTRVTKGENQAAFEAAFQAWGYNSYRNHELVRMFLRNPKAMEWEHVGSKDIGTEQTGFQATHFYRVRGPEGVFDIQIKLITSESKKGGKLRWHIPSLPQPNITQPLDGQRSEYGRVIKELEQEADAVARLWLAHLSGNRFPWAQLLTMPANHRRPFEESLLRMLHLGGATSAFFPLGPDMLPAERKQRWEERARKSPGTSQAAYEQLAFGDLVDHGFFRKDELGGGFSAEQLDRLNSLWWKRRLLHTSVRESQSPSGFTSIPTVTITPQSITVVVHLDIMLDQPMAYSKGTLGLVCTNPELLAWVQASKARGGSFTDNASYVLATVPARDWQVAWLQTDLEMIVPAAGPGAPRR
jgi:hypothetical protein